MISASSRRDLAQVTALYSALTLVLTWPLAWRLTADLPGDLGDPLFVTWILAWDATHLGPGLWHANIFHPHPLTLAYSEHLLPQAIRTLPVYVITRNPILSYNINFLLTFILSGVGMFLLVRELTGSRPAGVVAGLAYAFAPYRFANLPHLQVLSSEWMPFVLFALRRYFIARHFGALAFAGAAWLVQNVSCGYYLFFFSPIVVGYLGWELAMRRAWDDRRTLLALAIMIACVALFTVPFLLPYLQLRRLGVAPRSLAETIRFSADVHAYLTAAPDLRLIGRFVQNSPRPEGLLFPGFTIAILAGAAAVEALRTRDAGGTLMLRERTALVVLVGCCALVAALLSGWTLRLPGLKVTSLARPALVAGALAATLIAASRRIRARAGTWLASPAAFFTIAAAFAALMSFGPEIHSRGRVIAAGSLYSFFFRHVPGFDGLRVPARFAMIVALAMAALAGFAAVRLSRTRWHAALWLTAALIVAEAWAVPLPMSYSTADYERAGLAPLPAALDTESSRHLYEAVARLPGPAAIVELPLGEPAFDIRYMFYSTWHWKRLVNGYSGGRPPDYEQLDHALRDVIERSDYAWQELSRSGATHVIVHEAFYAGDRGAGVSAWLQEHGAREVQSLGRDRIFELPGSRKP